MLNPDKVDLIRNEVFQEVENFFKNKFASLNADLEKYRTESNKVANDLAVVEALLKTKEKDHNLALERMKHDYDEKVSPLAIFSAWSCLNNPKKLCSYTTENVGWLALRKFSL